MSTANSEKQEFVETLAPIYASETGAPHKTEAELASYFEMPYNRMTGRDGKKAAKHEEAKRFAHVADQVLEKGGKFIAKATKASISHSHAPHTVVLTSVNHCTFAEQCAAASAGNLGAIRRVIFFRLENTRGDRDLTEKQAQIVCDILNSGKSGSCKLEEVERRYEHYNAWIVTHVFGTKIDLHMLPFGNLEVSTRRALALCEALPVALCETVLFANISDEYIKYEQHNLIVKVVSDIPPEAAKLRAEFFGDSKEIAAAFAVQDAVRLIKNENE